MTGVTGCSVGIFVGCRVLGLRVGNFVGSGISGAIQFSPSLLIAVGLACAAVVVDDVEGFGKDDNVPLPLGLELMGHPVIPAKQLCDGSEHSSRDPPGHASHTRLALDADTPH